MALLLDLLVAGQTRLNDDTYAKTYMRISL